MPLVLVIALPVRGGWGARVPRAGPPGVFGPAPLVSKGANEVSRVTTMIEQRVLRTLSPFGGTGVSTEAMAELIWGLKVRKDPKGWKRAAKRILRMMERRQLVRSTRVRVGGVAGKVVVWRVGKLGENWRV